MGWKPLICMQGGGARGAWQAGVLEGLLEDQDLKAPVGMWGTSAGAINALWASTACENASHGHLLELWLAFARRLIVSVVLSVLLLLTLLLWCAIQHGTALILSGVCIVVALTLIAKKRLFGIERLPGLLSIRHASKILPFKPRPARWHAYFFTADVNLPASPEAWNWNTLGCFQMEVGSARARLILPQLGTDLDPRIAVMCSAGLPIVNRPLSFGSHLFLDGGLEANLPAGHLLDQGMSGGNCAICVVPRPLSSLDPCDHVDFRTLKFLNELKNAQQMSRMKVLGRTFSVHPPHTLRPILLIQPDQELKSGLAFGFLRPSILRQEFEEGYQEGRRLSVAMAQFKCGDDEALTANLLESCGLPSLNSGSPKAYFWKYWVNSRWN
jgi:predicted acylesterase/phospholipase RssA